MSSPSLFPVGSFNQFGGGYQVPSEWLNPAMPYPTASRGFGAFGVGTQQNGRASFIPQSQGPTMFTAGPSPQGPFIETPQSRVNATPAAPATQQQPLFNTQFGQIPQSQLDQIMRLINSGQGGLPISGAPTQQPAAPTPQSNLLTPNTQSSYAPAIDQFLANLTGKTSYLESMAQSGGNPIDTTPAWLAAVEAAKRNIAFKGADLAEQFNKGGNYFSTSFGNALSDFYSQTAKDQNAALLAAQAAASEAAQGRSLSASNALGQMGYGAGSQLSSQAFQANQGDVSRQFQALMQMGMGADQAAQLLAQAGNQGALALQQGSIYGATNLFNTENQAANSMYSQLMNLILSYLNYNTNTQQLGLQGASTLSNLLNQNLQTGSQLGAQQYNTNAAMIQALMQQWNQQQPQNNPLLQLISGAATGQQGYYFPQYQQSQLPQLMGGLGGILSGLGPWLKSMGIGGGN